MPTKEIKGRKSTKIDPTIHAKYVAEHGGKVIGKIQSKKNPSNFYSIVEGSDNVVYCSCPAWLFQSKAVHERSCKHIDEIMSSGFHAPFISKTARDIYNKITTPKSKGETDMSGTTSEELREEVKNPEPILKSKTSMIGLEYEEKVLESAMKCGLPSLLIGETGTGKTSLARELATVLGKRVVRINLDGGMTPDELVGRIMLHGSETKFEHGIIPKAMQQGACLILDEVNACLPDTLFVLHALLENPSRLLIPETGEEIFPAPGFCVIATMNPSHDYAGTKALNPAFYSRFGVTLRFESLSGEKLCLALGNHVPSAPASHIAEIASVIESINELRKQEKINTRISIREGLSALVLAQDGLTVEEAIHVALISRLESFEIEEIKKAGVKRIKIKSSLASTVEELVRKASETKKYEVECERLRKEIEKFGKLQSVMKTMREITSEVDSVPSTESVA